jgi:NAD(P)-dependent dehydrogenase (short-subunit alcohol dehydrogenase family)
VTTMKELSNLQGRSALITGAAGHLGKVFADTLAELGSNLILVDLPGSNLEEFSSVMSERWGIRVHTKYCDLEISSQRAELITWVKEIAEPLHILVNNAAFAGTTVLPGWSAPFEEQSLETWRRALEVNLTAIFHLCQGLTPLLKKAKGSSIINIASIYGVYGPDWSLYDDTNMSNPAAYGASKGGLVQLTRWLATTIAPEVRVNSISPGGILRSQPALFVNRYAQNTPLGRMASEDDFRGAVAFLASDMSGYITGQNLIVDGGWGTW